MKKMRLELDALEVDSFQTSWLANWEGTVQGAEATAGGATQCGGIQTCGDGCGGVSRGEVTQCGGVQTCGDGCPK